MKSAVACDECRQSKVKCFNDGTAETTCRRCEGLKKPCTYTPRWKQRKSLGTEIAKPPPILNKRLIRAKTAGPDRGSSSSPVLAVGKKKCACQLPCREDILAGIEAFFATQYQGIFPFIHKPTFVKFFKSEQFDPESFLESGSKEDTTKSPLLPDPLVLIALLALSARLCPPIVEKYGGFDENNDPHSFVPGQYTTRVCSPQAASKYFGWHARRLLKNEFDNPGLPRVQALAMLSSHEWGERNAARGYMYISIASRMALVLGLGSTTCNYKEPRSKTSNITLEVKRRTLWGCYMMDHCISSGRNRVPSIRVEEISIPMPSHENHFLFGSGNSSEMTFHQAMEAIKAGDVTISSRISLEGCKIIFFEMWAKVAKWVGEVGSRKESAAPWQSESTYYSIMKQIELVEQALPLDFRYSRENVEAHIANNTAGTYGYLHCLICLCKIFLNREYLYLRPQIAPVGWWSDMFATLVHSADACTDMVSSLISVNQMVLAPFTGFVAFTLTGINLYLGSFPANLFKENSVPVLNPNKVLRLPLQGDFTAQFKQERYQMTTKSIEILDTWNRVWSIAHNWMSVTNNIVNSLPGTPLESNEEFRDYGKWDLRDDDEHHHKPQPPSSLETNNNDNNTQPTIAQSTVDLEFLNNVDMGELIPGWNDVMNNELFPFTNFT